jgi:hypothetical protein
VLPCSPPWAALSRYILKSAPDLNSTGGRTLTSENVWRVVMLGTLGCIAFI